MPRAPKVVKSPRSLRQKTLLGFLQPSSSPAHLSSSLKSSPSTSRKRKRHTTKDAVYSSSSDSVDSVVQNIHFEPQQDDSTDGDEDGVPRSLVDLNDSTGELEQNVMLKDEDDDPQDSDGVSSHRPRKAASARKGVIISDSEGSLDVALKRKKFIRGKRPPSPKDDDDILDEIDPDMIIEPRLRARDKKTAFQKNLDKFKRGKKRARVSPSVSDNGEGGSDDGDSDGDSDTIPLSSARPTVGLSYSSDPEPDDDFIADEEDNSVAFQLPTIFSMNSYQDLAHHFKIICQLFVHVASQLPTERREFMSISLKDEYFSVPLQIARRKLIGMRDSLVASSVWRPDFKKPLEQFPELSITRMEFSLPLCDACHLGGRVSTLTGRLDGSPYHQNGFEPLNSCTYGASDSDQNSADDEDDEDEGDNRHVVFSLGRFCATRTRVFHEFTHWEYHLFQALLQEVEELQATNETRSFVRVAFAGGVKPPDDLTDADGIMDWLDQRGVIEAQWHKVKQMMKSARNLEIIAKNGEDLD